MKILNNQNRLSVIIISVFIVSLITLDYMSVIEITTNTKAQTDIDEPQILSEIVLECMENESDQVILEYFPVIYEDGFDPNRPLEKKEVKRRFKRGSDTEFFMYFDDSYNKLRNGRKHHAIDIIGPHRSKIVATTDGTIVGSWPIKTRNGKTHIYESGAGKTLRGAYFLRIMDDKGNIHYYSHLYDNPAKGGPGFSDFKSGDRVRAGQVIGRLGSTGTGLAHVHYQIRLSRPYNGKHSTTTPNVETFHNRGGKPYNPYCDLLTMGVMMHEGKISNLLRERVYFPVE